MKRSTPRVAQLCLLLLCSALVGAQTTTPRSTTQRYTIDWRNVDINEVAVTVGEATGITFIVAPGVSARVTVVNPQPMTAQQLYALFQNILAVHALAAVRTENGVKIQSEQVARVTATELPASQNGSGEEIVWAVLETKNINVNGISQVLRQMLTPNSGLLNNVPGTNSMIVSDRASNVIKLKKILAQVDQAPNSDVQVIRLENAIAAEVARSLVPLLTVQAADAAVGGVAPRVSADERTNSIYIIGDPSQRLRASALVDSLDAPVSNSGGTRVIPLKYADATDLAATLKAQVTGVTAAASGPTGAAGAASSVAAVADKNVVIQAHKESNSLLITAPPRTMTALQEIINALDITQPQVHIEAIVAEITDRKAADLGVNWAVFSNEENTNVPLMSFIQPVNGGTIANLAATVLDPAAAIAAGGLPQGATFGIGRISDTGISFAAMLSAIRTDGNSNIISLPNVTAKNNKEAEMKSGQKVPFVTSRLSNIGNGGNGGNNLGNPLTNVERSDVGTTLKVTPQIIFGTDEVILKIDLTSSALAGTTGDAGSLITNERSVKTEVQVNSGQTIVIGGMISNDSNSSESRVPGLGRIPLLGELFRVRSGKREKRNLMIFIQPRILRDARQASIETSGRYNQIRNLQLLQKNQKEIMPLLPFDTPPELPGLVADPAPAGAPAKP
ncbi:MAG: type II secretion system secretin GspD [Steroidobacteraceae bacterium]